MTGALRRETSSRRRRLTAVSRGVGVLLVAVTTVAALTQVPALVGLDAADRTGDRIVTDGDGDGIPDRTERAGWRSQGGRLFVTDPTDPDTDGDGLTDGEEAGRLEVLPAGGAAYEARSDPRDTDSDGDLLDDASEHDGGFNAWAADSDGDRLDDLVEIEFGSDPLSTNADGDHLDDKEEMDEGEDPNLYDLTHAQAAAAFAGAAIPTESLARKAGLSDEQISSLPYLVGGLAATYLYRVRIGKVSSAGTASRIRADVARGDWRSVRANLPTLLPAVSGLQPILEFPQQGGRATQAAMHLVAPALLLDPRLTAAFRALVRLDPAKARLSADAAVRGTPAPDALFTERPVSTSASQNERKDEIVGDLESEDYTDIRVNQQQVDATGEVVGINRPDIQATAPDGSRHYWVLEPPRSDRGAKHLIRILSNDDSGEVHLVEQD